MKRFVPALLVAAACSVGAATAGGTDIELFGASGDADYGQIGLVLGWGWD